MIVVGVDGSEGSIKALRFAIEEARLRKSPLRAIHAWLAPYVAIETQAVFLDDESLAQFREAADKVLADALAAVADEAKDVDLRGEVVEGPPSRELVKAAIGADLLVVGSRGLGGFRGLLLGSVSQQCAHHAPCPIAIVHPV